VIGAARRARGALALAVLCAFCIAVAAGAQETEPAEPEEEAADPDRTGVSDNLVLFGQSAAFSGPARDLGDKVRAGIVAAFREANFMGGVYGRRLELLSLDDAYEPEVAIANTRRLIAEDEVFALIGSVGTPTARAALPIAADAGVPYIAPFSGAAFLRDPERRNIVNLRASYIQETETIVDALVGERGIERIGVFFQEDSFGRAGYEGVRRALERHGLAPVATGVYPRNTTAVKTALLDLLGANPGAVVLVGSYRPVATAISWSRQIGFDPLFITVSFVGSNALASALGDAGVGVYATQVVPFPLADDPPVAAYYREALVIHSPGVRPGFVSLEGYLAGRLATFALERCGPDPGRACFIDAMRGADAFFDIDGFPLQFGEDDNQGSDAVFLTVIGDDGGFRPIDTLADPAQP